MFYRSMSILLLSFQNYIISLDRVNYRYWPNMIGKYDSYICNLQAFIIAVRIFAPNQNSSWKGINSMRYIIQKVRKYRKDVKDEEITLWSQVFPVFSLGNNLIFNTLRHLQPSKTVINIKTSFARFTRSRRNIHLLDLYIHIFSVRFNISLMKPDENKQARPNLRDQATFNLQHNYLTQVSIP